MRYKVFCSTEYDHEYFRFDSKDQAVKLYNMAIDSHWFEYVCLYEIEEKERIVKDWSEDNG